MKNDEGVVPETSDFIIQLSAPLIYKFLFGCRYLLWCTSKICSEANVQKTVPAAVVASAKSFHLFLCLRNKMKFKVKNDHRSKFSNLSNWKEEAWKNQGFNGIRTRDLHDTGAMLYQLSYEATHWSPDFFRLLLSNCLNWKIYCDDHSSLWSTTAVQIYELFHIYLTSFHSSREIWTQ